MLSEISWYDFQKWALYARIEPFDEWRADLRAAQVVQTMTALWSTSARKPLGEYALKFDKPAPKPKQTPQEQFLIAQMWAATAED